MRRQTPIGREAIRRLRAFLIAQHGSVRRAAQALGGGRRLEDYFYDCNIPLGVFLDVAVRSGFPLSHLELDASISLGASCFVHLEGVQKPKNRDSHLVEVEGLVDKVLRKLHADGVTLSAAYRCISKDIEELNLGGLHLATMKMDKEWKRLKKELRRRRPGGILITDEVMQDLGRFLLLRTSIEIKSERFGHAAGYLRCFFKIPLSGGDLPLYGLFTLVKVLRSVGDVPRAKHLAETHFASVLAGGNDVLRAFAALIYAALLSEVGRQKDSLNILRYTVGSAESLWSWYGALGLGEALETSGRYRESVDLLSRINIPRSLPNLKYLSLWTLGCAHRGLGNEAEARACLWQSLRMCPERIGGFNLVILLLDLLEAGEQRTLIFQELRDLEAWLTCPDRRSAPKLRAALRGLEKELLRPDGVRLRELHAVRSLCR